MAALEIFWRVRGAGLCAGGLQQLFPAADVRERRRHGALVVMATIAAFLIFQFTRQMESMGRRSVDWRLVPANFDFVALWVLARWPSPVPRGWTRLRRWQSAPGCF